MYHVESGDDGKVDTPVPIPNTEVKHFNADGSTMCESRKLPGSKEAFVLPFLFHKKKNC